MSTLKKIVTEFTKGILDNRPPKDMCFMVCWPLSSYLRVLGYDNELVEGEITLGKKTFTNHFWIELPNGLIIDPTASQFKTPEGRRMPKIYIGEKPYWYYQKNN